jgi:hypothetical protein
LFFLNVRSNSLSDIELEPITGLRKLKLGNNILIEIPNWCDAKLNSYFPNYQCAQYDLMTETYHSAKDPMSYVSVLLFSDRKCSNT